MPILAYTLQFIFERMYMASGSASRLTLLNGCWRKLIPSGLIRKLMFSENRVVGLRNVCLLFDRSIYRTPLLGFWIFRMVVGGLMRQDQLIARHDLAFLYVVSGTVFLPDNLTLHYREMWSSAEQEWQIIFLQRWYIHPTRVDLHPSKLTYGGKRRRRPFLSI